MNKLKNLMIISVLCISSVKLSAQDSNIPAEDKAYRTFTDRILNDPELMHIRLDTRIDYRSLLSNDSTIENSFRGNTLKLWIVGEITPGIRYRLRHRLNRSQAALRENYGPATDQAYFEFDVKDKITFRVGKQAVQFGTFEYDYNPADVYMTTMCFDDLDAYKTGVNFAYKLPNHVLNLQIINSDFPQFASFEYRNKALAGLFLWEGNFNDIFKTRWGWASFQKNGSSFNHWLTLGNQFNIGKLMMELDWYIGNRDMETQFYDDITNSMIPYDQRVFDNSISLNLQWDLGKLKPAIKGVYDSRHPDIPWGGDHRNIGLQAAIEYYPFTEGRAKDLRFHAMYAFNESTYSEDPSKAKINQHTLLMGLRWMFNVR